MKIFNWTTQPHQLSAWNKLTTEIDEDGDRWYRVNGRIHRTKGPAAEYADGSKLWYQNGMLHRLDGPAMEFSDGYREWFYLGKAAPVESQAEFEQWLKDFGFNS